MKTILPVLLLVTVILDLSAADNSTSYAPAKPYFLSTNSPTYFFSDVLTGATYTKFSPDGHYVYIMIEHMGVWPGADGKWTQSTDGIITLISTNLCADIICEPLEILVGWQESVSLLPKLQRKIAEFLNSNVKDEYVKNDLTGLAVGEYTLKVEFDLQTQRKSVTRAELQALLHAVNDFINKPALRNERLIPLSYKGKVFLVKLNQAVDRDYKKVCEAIDMGTNSQAIIYNDFMVTEEHFNKGTKKPYSFKFHQEMNKITGAK